jgi:hypothetical protein
MQARMTQGGVSICAGPGAGGLGGGSTRPGGGFNPGLLPGGFEGFRLQDGLLWAEGAAPGDPGHPVTTLYVGNLPPQVWEGFHSPACSPARLLVLQGCSSTSVCQQLSMSTH